MAIKSCELSAQRCMASPHGGGDSAEPSDPPPGDASFPGPPRRAHGVCGLGFQVSCFPTAAKGRTRLVHSGGFFPPTRPTHATHTHAGPRTVRGEVLCRRSPTIVHCIRGRSPALHCIHDRLHTFIVHCIRDRPFASGLTNIPLTQGSGPKTKLYGFTRSRMNYGQGTRDASRAVVPLSPLESRQARLRGSMDDRRTRLGPTRNAALHCCATGIRNAGDHDRRAASGGATLSVPTEQRSAAAPSAYNAPRVQ